MNKKDDPLTPVLVPPAIQKLQPGYAIGYIPSDQWGITIADAVALDESDGFCDDDEETDVKKKRRKWNRKGDKK